jgi:hypothetical protein
MRSPKTRNSVRQQTDSFSMTPDVVRFLAQIKAEPEFRAAAANSPKAAIDMQAVERNLELLYRAGADDERMLELFDEIRAVVAQRNRRIKTRLAGILKVLERANAGRKRLEAEK